jgi:hypothetical protein
MDSPPKQACVALPVVHLTCCQITDKANQQDPSKAAEIYSCPVYASRISAREPIFEMDVKKEGISSYRWSLRGLLNTYLILVDIKFDSTLIIYISIGLETT